MQAFLLFTSTVGARLLPVQHVVEVIPFVRLQAQVSSNPCFRGLLNYRGRVLPVFDFSICQADDNQDHRRFLVITTSEAGDVCLLADEVQYLLEVPNESIFPVKSAGNERFLVAKVGKDMIRIVDMLEFAE